ncbi:MAG: hypothetical protein KTR31_24885 [Myxococcales bacterium]|nr:hypothetical protein [Myxococcales bacterium]
MGEMITKPDANPFLLAILNLIPCGVPVGYFLMGQQKKAIFGLIYVWVPNVLCFGLGTLFAVMMAYDAYLLGQKLASGESIGELENGLDFLDSVPGFK